MKAGRGFATLAAMGSAVRSRLPRWAPLAALVVLGALLLAAAALAAEVRSVTLLSTGPVSGNGPAEPSYFGASPDGTHVFFWTEEQLVVADPDLSFDVYERAGDATTLVSTGPDGGNGEVNAFYKGCSDDGSRVFFETAEALLEEDTDAESDIYERAGETTTLISTGPNGGNGATGAHFSDVTPDGARVFFWTEEQLVAADTDEEIDVYRRVGGTTTRISTGPNGGNGANGASFLAASDDGTRSFIWSNEQLTVDDTDIWYDVYERASGTTTRVSTGPTGGNEGFNALLVEASADGTRAILRTNEALTATDTDEVQDIYERSGGETVLLSVGPGGGNGAHFVVADGVSADGGHVFFETAESLLAADTDSETDVYERAGETTTLVSVGPDGGNGAWAAAYAGASDDGNHVFFETDEQLLSADTDSSSDVYERAGETLTLVSVGPAGGNGPFGTPFTGVSADGSHVFFQTLESLLPTDTDTATDVYVRAGAGIDLVTAGTTTDSYHLGASSDGARSYFSTEDQLSAADTDTLSDIYLSTLVPAVESVPPAGTAATEEAAVSSPPKCMGKPATLTGTGAGERLKGTGKRDVIVGFGGDDRIFGYGGNDLICAGSGDDTAKGGPGRDEITGGSGTDRLYGEGGQDRVFGQGGGDRLFGGGAFDLLNGSQGTDTCRPGADKDRQPGCEH